MAVDMFIKIDTVDGEAQDSKHKKAIDVLSWSWGLSNSGSAHVGGGAGAGKVMFKISQSRNGLTALRRNWLSHAAPANILRTRS
jgi:type VI protein secretion system component Hcp